METHGNALIRESIRKTDRRDASQLREQGRLSMLPPHGVYCPTQAEEELRTLIHSRAKAVRDRTAISNRTTRVSDKYGLYLSRGACCADRGWELLFERSSNWSLSDQLLLKQYFEQYQILQKQIEALEQEIRNRAAEEAALSRNVELLRTIPGIGLVTSHALATRIGDLRRFSGSRKLSAYCGLAPTQRQSGTFQGGGRLSKKSGNSLLRAYLTQAALGVIQSKDAGNPLKIWYEQVKKRRGWKKARVALARKILTVSYGVLKSGKPFNPDMLWSKPDAVTT
jgi:transposase